MKFVTFNIRQGGGDRVEGIVTALMKHDADTIVLTEYRENKNSDSIKRALFDYGYTFFSQATIEKHKNSVAIASKKPFVTTTFHDELKAESHRVLHARFAECSLLAVYFAQKKEKKILFDFISARHPVLLGEKGLVLGDFNTGKHYIDESKATFHCSREFEKLEESGLIDSWRSVNGDTREFTWYSNKGNGFRIDHIFSTPSMNVRINNAFYSHTEREGGVSDHSALIVDYQ